MGDRRRKDERRENRRDEAAAPRMSKYFVPGAGIDREVITTDICRYLGNDALVRPGEIKNSRNEIIEGYVVTAYRALTTNQLSDIKADSVRWQNERNQNSRANTGETYRGSLTHREQWGPEPGAEYSGQGQGQSQGQGQGQGQGQTTVQSRVPDQQHYPASGYAAPGGQLTSASYPRAQEYAVDPQNYSYDTRSVPMGPPGVRADQFGSVQQIANYEVASRNLNPRFQQGTGYGPESPAGRGAASNPGYPGASSYAQYPDPGGMPAQTGGGRQPPPQGVPYDQYPTQQQPRDPVYGRTQAGADEGYAANDEEFENEAMNEDPSRYDSQPTREPQRAAQRETPPTNKRSHHGDREHRRR